MVDPPKDEGLELLLQEISRTISENRRFLQALQEDRIDRPPDQEVTPADQEEFEEL